MLQVSFGMDHIVYMQELDDLVVMITLLGVGSVIWRNAAVVRRKQNVQTQVLGGKRGRDVVNGY